uniref:Solute carrier organic anion transporter family member 2B1 n=1 Tax=Myotis myotis TaxID=51298 RepID=A0A7J7VKH7_MYOMY|nr:solute carrier organic anion transporter family member 2B1 [Myotis myotis]
MGPRIGPVGMEPQMTDKDTKAMMGTEDTPGDKASPDSQDLRPSVFHSIKFFVLCHSLLQLAQLMISGYLKSSISTVEKRFGLSSQTSGLLAAFNEVGNTTLIVFVSYFGSRVHRPRLIGCGAILVALAGLLMTLPKFLERQFSITASYANMLIGCLSIPSAIVGIVVGGILVKRLHLGPMRCSVLCLLGALFCLLFTLPLFFMGCPTHQIAGIFHRPGSQPGLESFPGCMEPCACPPDDFNPVCDPSTGVEYLTPCHAGCTTRVVQEALNKSQVFYTNCSCVAGGGPVPAGSCDSACSHLVLPFMLLISLGAAMASVTHTPSFMLILRGVKKEDKTLAVGIQFMLLRVLAWMPSPVIHGSAIDTTCVHWDWSCGRRAVCRYYDHDLLRTRFIGLQFFFKTGSLACFALIMAILRQQGKEEGTKVVTCPGLQQQPLMSGPEKKPEESRV